MATWIIGDVQGCFRELQDLLALIDFRQNDQIYFCGDLVNRGPDSRATLEFIYAHRAQMHTVLGNHDLHMLASWYARRPPGRKDSFVDVFRSPIADAMLQWLSNQPLLLEIPGFDAVLTHAGIPHIWSSMQAKALANEVHVALQDPAARKAYLEDMYGNAPAVWHESLTGTTRLRVITNYLTRMRFVRKSDGALDLTSKEGIDTCPDDFAPWFALRQARNERLFFGHWAALMGETHRNDIVALDTGCVWGNTLTAYNPATAERVSVPSRTA